jgi:hypothetical protein
MDEHIVVQKDDHHPTIICTNTTNITETTIGDNDLIKVINIESILASSSTNKKRLRRNTKTKQEPMYEPKKERVITQSSSWTKQITHTDLTDENQYNLLKLLEYSVQNDSMEKPPKLLILFREIRRKIEGYRCQDLEKSKYNDLEFIVFKDVVQKLIQCKMICFYCQEKVKLLYLQVRDPKQWTLERIDNQVGHNRTNVEIACLSCNVRRRTMYHEKFRFTKQLVIQKNVS